MNDLCAELDWLYSTQLFGIKLGLAGITRLLRSLDVASVAPQTRVIHVAGTNGKGSTCATVERIARAAGYRTGLFTSPHLVRFHERIRVDGEMISDARLGALIRRLREHVAGWGESTPTFFELVFALALLYFQEQGCDLLILETGMGGRLDATNAIAKDVAIITPIALDHTQYLGETLAAIAGEKAGIIHAGNKVITAPQEPAAAAVIRDHCCAIGAELLAAAPPLPSAWTLSLTGAHQRENAALALHALRALPADKHKQPLSDELITAALADVHWAGRFERVTTAAGKTLILDGAHNPHAMRALVTNWQATYGSEPVPCLFACSADKELPRVIDILNPLVSHWHLVPVDSARIMPVSELAELISQRSTKPVVEHACISAGLDGVHAQHPRALACGSFFLLGELQAHIEGYAYRQTAQ